MTMEFELAPLVGGVGRPSPPLRRNMPNHRRKNDDAQNDTATRWKYFPAFLAVGLFILFIMDSIEIDFTSSSLDDGDSKGTNQTSTGHMGGHVHITNGGAERAHITPWDESKHEGQYVDYDATKDIDIEDQSVTHTYSRRARTLSWEEVSKLEEEWGTWTLEDDKERPKQDFYSSYKNRDVPREEFPSSAWQLDPDYVREFLHQGKALVRRVSEAILTEYGYGEGSEYSIAQNLTTFEDRSYMFGLDFLENETLPSYKTRKETNNRVAGGWTTPLSWMGLQRRMLHSIMTEDTFVFAMGGHSAAAGHG